MHVARFEPLALERDVHEEVRVFNLRVLGPLLFLFDALPVYIEPVPATSGAHGEQRFRRGRVDACRALECHGDDIARTYP